MHHNTDEKIWELCLKGERKAFEVLYRRFYSILYSIGKMYVKNTDFIKDCLQNFFIKLMLNYATLSPTAFVRAYLLKAFRNMLYNELRAELKRNDVLNNCYEDCLTFHVDQLLDEEDQTPENKRIWLAVKQLSSKQQKILYLYYIKELSHEEIAAFLNINYQSSKNLHFRAIAKLRTLLISEKLVSVL